MNGDQQSLNIAGLPFQSPQWASCTTGYRGSRTHPFGKKRLEGQDWAHRQPDWPLRLSNRPIRILNHAFSTSVLARMPQPNPPYIANELRSQFEWSQQHVPVNNPEHVLASHVRVYYDRPFLYIAVRVLEHLSVYENPALSRSNALVFTGVPNVWATWPWWHS
jgi:hypothetical protein